MKKIILITIISGLIYFFGLPSAAKAVDYNVNGQSSFGPFPETGELVLFSKKGGGVAKIGLRKNATSCSLADANLVLDLPNGWTRTDTDFQVDANDTLCIYEEDIVSCPNNGNPCPGVGWEPPNDQKCGRPPFSIEDVSGLIAQATVDIQDEGGAVVSQQCWGDWPEWEGDYDFNDYFFIFAFKPPPACSQVNLPACIDVGQNFTAEVNSVENATKVRFPTWDSEGGNDDLVSYEDTSGPPWSYDISQAKHPNGSINVNVYAENEQWTDIFCGEGTVIVPCATPPPAGSVPWWQVKDGDVLTGGKLKSLLPESSDYFELAGDSGFPGIPAYAKGTANFGGGQVSDKGWLVKTANNQNPYSVKALRYHYKYFFDRVPSAVIWNELNSEVGGNKFNQGQVSKGYAWFKRGDDLSINSDVLLEENRKVVLFVDGNLTIKGNIGNIEADNKSFFMAIVSKDIMVDSEAGVEKLEGIFVANQKFGTGDDNQALQVRGTIAAWGGVDLQRKLEDNTVGPAETFEFAPDLVLDIPYSFGVYTMKWKEVAP